MVFRRAKSWKRLNNLQINTSAVLSPIAADVVFVVCTFLDPHTIWFGVRLCCKEWRVISLQNSLWENLYYLQYGKITHVNCAKENSNTEWWRLYKQREKWLNYNIPVNYELFEPSSPSSAFSPSAALEFFSASPLSSSSNAKHPFVSKVKAIVNNLFQGNSDTATDKQLKASFKQIKDLCANLKKSSHSEPENTSTTVSPSSSSEGLSVNEKMNMALAHQIEALCLALAPKLLKHKEKDTLPKQQTLLHLKNCKCYMCMYRYTIEKLIRIYSGHSRYDKVIVYATHILKDFGETIKKSNKPEDYSQMLFYRGYALYKLKMYQEALEDFDNCQQMNFHRLSSVIYCRMFCHVKLKNISKAYEDYLKIKDTKRKYTLSSPHCKLGEYAFSINDLKEAKRLFSQSCNSKNRGLALRRLFEIYVKLENLSKAQKAWEELLRFCKENPETKYHLELLKGKYSSEYPFMTSTATPRGEAPIVRVI